MTDFQAAIAEVLVGHGTLTYKFGGEVLCECGESLGSYRKDQFPQVCKDRAAHQAAMLAPIIRDAQAEALEDAGGVYPYTRRDLVTPWIVAHWLIRRAAQMRAES